MASSLLAFWWVLAIAKADADGSKLIYHRPNRSDPNHISESPPNQQVKNANG